MWKVSCLFRTALKKTLKESVTSRTDCLYLSVRCIFLPLCFYKTISSESLSDSEQVADALNQRRWKQLLRMTCFVAFTGVRRGKHCQSRGEASRAFERVWRMLTLTTSQGRVGSSFVTDWTFDRWQTEVHSGFKFHHVLSVLNKSTKQQC